MAEWEIWVNSRCSKSRGAVELLAELGIPARQRAYLEDPPTRAELEKVLGKLGTSDARELARPDYRGPEDNDAVLDALAGDASLIERPIVVHGDRAVVARPPERLRQLLDGGTAQGA